MTTTQPLETILEKPIEEVEFIVFDTETSLMSQIGHSAFYDMVEIAMVGFNLKSNERKTFHSLVRPYYPFNRASCKAMHITELVLNSAPSFPEVSDAIADMLANRLAVGQNIQFDIRSIKHATELYASRGKLSMKSQIQLNSYLESANLDTIKIYSSLFPEEKQKSLDAISAKIGINSQRLKHSALDDASLTLEVFVQLLQIAKQRKVQTLRNLFDLQDGTFGEAKQISMF